MPDVRRVAWGVAKAREDQSIVNNLKAAKTPDAVQAIANEAVFKNSA